MKIVKLLCKNIGERVPRCSRAPKDVFRYKIKFFLDSMEYPQKAEDLLLDFKIYASDIYEENVTEEDSDPLVVLFHNGQKFRMIVKEIKLQL